MNRKDIWIEPNVIVKKSVCGNHNWIRSFSNIINTSIMNDVFVGYSCSIRYANIQSYVQIAGKVVISGEKYSQVYISSYAWIGVGAHIYGGVSISEGAVIGAGAVVRHDVSPYQIVIGNPAHLLKKRIVQDNQPPTFYKFMNYVKMHPQSPNIRVRRMRATGNVLFNSDINLKGNIFIDKNTILDGKHRKNKFEGGIHGEGNIQIGNNCLLELSGGIFVKGNLRIGNNVIIETMTHDYSYLKLPQLQYTSIFEENVSLGDGSIILPGTKIPAETNVPPNSIVTRNKTITNYKNWK